MVKVILTADRTLLSEYNKHVFIGFAACGPKVLPTWLYTRLFCPPVDEENGQLKYGHCGQRKLEAALVRHGFSPSDIAVVSPEKISQSIDRETKVLGITTHDPLGIGPASSTFGDLAGKETFTSIFFHKIIATHAIRTHSLKVIVGGAGAWQLSDERIMAKYGIDGVVVGEGEITGVDVISKAVNDEPFPPISQGEVVPLEQIPLITKPTLNGLIEICRGCGRGCRFCNPTMMNYRCQPVERILEEVKLNLDAGTGGVILHAEDVLRYKTKGFIPNDTEVVRLFEAVKKITDYIGFSHFAHASVASNEGLVKRLSEIMQTGSKTCPFISAQVGIESGSPRIIAKYMKGKARPFTPQQWPEMIVQSHKILQENHWVPVNTIIFGLPGEEPDDIMKTKDLVEDLAEYKSIIIPLFFVPIGNLGGQEFFRVKHMRPEHWMLLAVCLTHTISWMEKMADEYLISSGMNRLKAWGVKQVVYYADHRLQPYIKMMRDGINPLTPKT
jgi:radical SAM superfamily enzyme YgiQ (UPF0313 family)